MGWMMDRPLYYDRQGQPMSVLQWAAKVEDMSYRRVAESTVGAYWVSTVWVGLDLGLGWLDGDAPKIFETMVFFREMGMNAPMDERRYSTEAQAIHGHDQMVAELRARVPG